MEPLANLFLRVTSALEDRVQQVFTGTYEQPLGGKLGRVLIGRCVQSVDAARFSNHNKGDPVMVVGSNAGTHQTGYAILPAPPGNPGPAAVATLKISGVPFTAPVPQEVVGLHFTLDDNPPTIFAFEYDQATGTPLELIMSTPALSGSHDNSGMVATGFGAGRFVISHAFPPAFGNSSGRDYLMVVNARTGLVSSYVWSRPPDPNGARYRISDPAIKDGDIYWVELEFDNGANEHTWELMRAPGGSLGAAAVDDSLLLSNTTWDAGTVEDPAIRPTSNNLPFFDETTSTWEYDVLIRWWNGTQFIFPNLALTIQFGPTTQEISQIARVNPKHVVRGGNVGVSTSLAAEFNSGGTPALIWPASGDTATPLTRVVSGIGLDEALDNSYVVMTRPGFTPDGLFDWREGDLANPTPAITLVDCADASGLVGGKALEPMAGMRA